MAGACSKDLRSRVLAAVEAGESMEAVAMRFSAGRSTQRQTLRVSAVTLGDCGA